MHDLQNEVKIGWDQKLDSTKLKTWKNISSQVNSSPRVKIPRFVGARDNNYELVAYVDSSKVLYGTVIYIRDIITDETSFYCSKNRMVTNNLAKKSIASLELKAIELGVDLLHKCRE